MQIKFQSQLLNVFHVVLNIFAGNKLKIILSFHVQYILFCAFYLNIRLSLFRALDSDERRTGLFIVRTFLLNLIAETFFCVVCWYWQFINLIHLHWRHLIKLSWSLQKFELRLSLKHENSSFIGHTKYFLSNTHCDLICALVTILSAGNPYHWLSMLRVDYGS